MKRRIKKARIRFISLVPKGANKLPVILKDDGSISLKTAVCKFDEAEGLLTAIVYAPEFRDSQGDIASSEVVKDMAYDYLVNGGLIDVRHDGQALTKEQAAVVESFIVQKGDPRFTDLVDYEGNAVDPTGAWATVIKIFDEEYKKLYTSGEYNGVSMGGTAEVEQEKEAEDMPLSKDDLKAVGETVGASVIAALKADREAAEAKAKEEADRIAKEEADRKAKAKSEAPVFKGDPSSLEDVKKHQEALARYELRKDVDWGNPESVAEYTTKLEALQKSQSTGRVPSNQPAGSAGNISPEDLELSIGKEMSTYFSAGAAKVK